MRSIVRDIVRLYLAPPDCALVLGVDGSSAAERTNQIQARDRTQPLLPLRPGQVERRTLDDARRGETSLFAALDATAALSALPTSCRGIGEARW